MYSSNGSMFVAVMIGTIFLYVSVSPVSAKTLETLINENELFRLTSPHFDVGNQPEDVDIAKIDDRHFAYVSNLGSDSVSVIDINTMKISKIPVGDNPTDITIGKDKAYVANAQSWNVSVINVTTNTEIERVPVGQKPMGLAFYSNVDKETNKEYVKLFVNTLDDNVTVIDGNDYTVHKIPVEGSPDAMILLSDKLFVVNSGRDSVSVINAANNTNISRIKVGDQPAAIAEQNGQLFVANSFSNNVSVINANADNFSEIARIPVGIRPTALAVDGKQNVIVSNSGSNNVSVINANADNFSEIARIPVGIRPTAVAMDFHKLTAYIVNSGSADVSVVTTNNYTEVKRIPVGQEPVAIVLMKLITHCTW